MEGFRSAFRQGRLHKVGPESYALDVIPRRFWRTRGRMRVTYVFDRATARVRRIVSSREPARGSRAPLSRMVLNVERYEHLSVTAASRRSLSLLAHPGAGPTPIDAADHFIVLRDGAVPAARTMATLRKVTSYGPRVVELATGRMIDNPRARGGPFAPLPLITDTGGVARDEGRPSRAMAQKALGIHKA